MMAKGARTDPGGPAAQLREALAGLKGVTEKRMFGGVCFMLRDHMLCGTGKPGFMFRVGPEGEAEALSRRGAERMAFNGREFRGFVWVDPEACGARDLGGWIALAKSYVDRLPPKSAKVAGSKRKKGHGKGGRAHRIA